MKRGIILLLIITLLIIFVLVVLALPTITLVFSTLSNNSYTNSNYVFVNVTSNESLNKSLLEWGNSTGFTNISMSNSSLTNWYVNMTNLADYAYNYTIWAQNTSLNWSQSTRYFITVDTIKPNINFTYPTPANGISQSSTSLYVNVSTNDTNEHSAFIDWNRSLIGYWNFENVLTNGTIYDNSSYANNGVMYNFLSNTTVAGKRGRALQFDGINGYVNISDDPRYLPDNFTLEAWIKVDGNNNGSAGTIIYHQDSNTNSGYRLEVRNNTKQVQFYIRYLVDNNLSWVTSNTSLTIGMWYHIATTFENISGYGGQNIMKIYINGVLENITTTVSTPTQPSYPIQIGVRQTSINKFNGTIDEVMIFNRALSPEEINASYQAGAYRLYHNFTNLAGGSYNYTAYAIDAAGNMNSTEQRSLTIDTSPPVFSNFTNNYSNYNDKNPKYGDLIYFIATLSDDTGIAGYIISCDFTGNSSYVPVSGTSYNLNFTKTANLSEGGTGCCYVWSNDTYGNSGKSSNSCFVMKTRTKININYNSIDHTINPLIFGEGIEISTSALGSIFTSTGYNSTYFPVSQTIGFTDLRFAGANCESYDWNLYVGDNSSVLNYRRWRNYSINITGNEPVFCVKISDPYNITKATAWLNDTINQGFNITYWEMGNENYNLNCNGTLNATCYALRAKEVCTAMKQIKPNIKCGLDLAAYSDQNVSGENWNDKVLGIAGNFTDFVVPHYYSPLTYFDTYAYYTSSPQTYNFNVNGNANYSVRINAKSQNCCEAPDGCYPLLSIQVDNNTVLLNNVTTNTSWGAYNTSYNLSLSPGAHSMLVNFPNDYSNSSDGCDKNLWVANLSVTNGTEIVPIALWDNNNWTYSFLASTDTYIKNDLVAIKNNIDNKVNHSMDIMITEYNWHYGTDTYVFSGFSSTSQYDWRQNLFTALMLNTWLQQNITQADVWSDLATGYWRYVSTNGIVKYPLYYILNLYSGKTGNYYVNFTTENLNTYNSSAVLSGYAPNVTNEPYLSIAPSIDTNNNIDYLTIVNRNQDDSELVQVNLNNNTPIVNPIYVTVLTANNLSSHPYVDSIPIVPAYFIISSATGIFNYTIPPYSIVNFQAYRNLSAPPALSGYPYPSYLNLNQQSEIFLLINQSAQFTINNQTHIITLDSIINNTAVITVSSQPVTFNLTVNQTEKIGLNNDSYYDTAIFLKNISSNMADLIITPIHEEIPENAGCNNGDQRCLGNAAQTCFGNSWTLSQNCQFGCARGECLSSQQSPLQNILNSFENFINNLPENIKLTIGNVAYYSIILIIVLGAIVILISIIRKISRKRSHRILKKLKK